MGLFSTKKKMFDKKKYNQEYHLHHIEKEKKYSREYYTQHKEKVKKCHQEYTEKHKEKLKKYYQEYKEKHKKKLNAKKREKMHKKGININFYLTLGISDTPIYKKMKGQERRCNMRNAGKLTLATIQQVYDENIVANSDVLKCIYCDKELTLKQATLEHKQPITREGTNDKENLAIACGHCNHSKNNKTEAEFEEYLINKGGKNV